VINSIARTGGGSPAIGSKTVERSIHRDGCGANSDPADAPDANTKIARNRTSACEFRPRSKFAERSTTPTPTGELSLAIGGDTIEGPFTGTFNACIWNCRSLWSKRNDKTFREAIKLAEIHDFLVLLETRENMTRRKYIESVLPASFCLFSTHISARRGGVAIIIKRAFLEKFSATDWSVVVAGRVAKLTLSGPRGKLCIIPAYLDPSSTANQIEQIRLIGDAIADNAHNVVAGDFNFVECCADRITKTSAAISSAEDKRQAEQWNLSVGQRGLHEFEQPEYTCENSHGWSRIDRIYSDLHAAHWLCSSSFCTRLDHSRHLSDHSPISFGIKDTPRKCSNTVPTWVAFDDEFGNEVKDELEYLTKRRIAEHGTEPDAMQKLDNLKTAIRNASKYVKRKSANAVAATTTHKLACTLSFIRATEKGDLAQAERMKRKYRRLDHGLQTPLRSTCWYKELKEHAVELMRSEIGDRVQELKSVKSTTPLEIYERRKISITRQLKMLIPAGSSSEIAIIKDQDGNLFSDSSNIARILAEHWQKTFEDQPTNATLRAEWLERIRDRFKVDLQELRPIEQDVKKVFDNLRDSAAGPDGIPTGVYMKLKRVAPRLFLDLVLSLLDGSVALNDGFNHAYLCCIPKPTDERSQSGEPVHVPGSTRPLSIVDASNRIVAAIMNVALERCVANKISGMQRGFVPGRQMLLNLIDVDTAAQKISVKSSRGAIILFDFRAAFPSMNHSFIWETLKMAGIPTDFIDAIRALYSDNKHLIKIDGGLFDGPTVRSGVRQGCPLSGLLFAICADVLLLRLQDALKGEDDTVCAFADDTAVVLEDYVLNAPTVDILFSEFAQISKLELNISKTLFIPLWPMSSERGLRNLIIELCPRWKQVGIRNRGKYLGFVIGPHAKDDSWTAPLKKFDARIKQWQHTKCGLFWNTEYFNTFCVTTLEFIAQLEELPDIVLNAEKGALRQLARGPGNWISNDDLEHLSAFGIGQGLRRLEWTAKAAKLRLLHSIGGRYLRAQAESIRKTQSESWKRPFGRWHSAGYAKTLCDNEVALKLRGITWGTINEKVKSGGTASFQRACRALITQKIAPYSLYERVRHKAKRWKFQDPPHHVSERLVWNINLFSSLLPAAVRASYLRALWNGVPTSRRMKSLSSFAPCNCVFDCSPTAEDSLEHYFRCPRVRRALGACCAHVWFDTSIPVTSFFGVVKGMPRADKLVAGRLVHVTLRIVHCARRMGPAHDFAFIAGLEWSKTFG
jgi:endonuclease/exonuclease/phosphatase family metal-dependent hydrolase